MIVAMYAQAVVSLLLLERQDLILYTKNVIERHCSHDETLIISYDNQVDDTDTAEGTDLLTINSFLRNVNEYKWPPIILHTPHMNEIQFYKQIIVQTYLIFVRYEKVSEDLHGIIKQIESLSYIDWWNAKANFFIVITDIFSSCPHSAALRILDVLWKNYGVLKTFVIVATEAQSSFQLYTRLPGHTQGSCTAFSDLLLLEQWLFEDHVNFPNQSYHNIHEIPTKFNGCPLKVSSSLREYKQIGHVNNTTKLEYYEAEMTFLYAVLEKMNATLVHNSPHTNSTFTEDLVKSLTQVIFKEADIAVGGVPVNEQVTQFLSVAKSYFRYRASWFVPCRQHNSRVESLSRVFDNYTWLIIVTSLLATAMTMKYLALEHVTESTNFRCFSAGLLSLWATVLGVGIPELPQTVKLRLLFSIFLWYSIAINTVFLTYFTSFILEPGFKERVHDLDQLLSSGIQFGFDELYDYNFEVSQDERDFQVLKRREICRDRKGCFDRVSITGDFAYLDNSQSMLMYSILNKDPRICALDDGGISHPMALVMQKDSVLLEPINRVISNLFEAGVAQKLEHDYLLLYKSGKIISKWFNKNGTVNSYNNEKNEYVPLGLDHLHISFYFLFLGLTVGVLAVLVELIHFKM